MEGYVYLFEGFTRYERFHKIGFSVNPEKRLKQLNLPFEVDLVHKIKTNDMRTVERDFHERYKNDHYHGEWYSLDTPQIKWFKNIISIKVVQVANPLKLYLELVDHETFIKYSQYELQRFEAYKI